jgi:NAD(P)-dependent dehydrogenase (short-subunit alcohol dehydrogenase family)
VEPPLGIRVLAVEPGAFRTRAYAGFADEPVTETIEDYWPMLESSEVLAAHAPTVPELGPGQ